MGVLAKKILPLVGSLFTTSFHQITGFVAASITQFPAICKVTLIALLLIEVAVVKVTIDYKGSNLAKAAIQRNTCEKNMEVNLCLPVQRCAENNSVNSAKVYIIIIEGYHPRGR